MSETVPDSALLAVSDRAELGAILRAARQRAGWTQSVLAENAGVAQGKISRIERGESYPPLVTIGQLGEALGLRVQISLSAV